MFKKLIKYLRYALPANDYNLKPNEMPNKQPAVEKFMKIKNLQQRKKRAENTKNK